MWRNTPFPSITRYGLLPSQSTTQAHVEECIVAIKGLRHLVAQYKHMWRNVLGNLVDLTHRRLDLWASVTVSGRWGGSSSYIRHTVPPIRRSDSQLRGPATLTYVTYGANHFKLYKGAGSALANSLPGLIVAEVLSSR